MRHSMHTLARRYLDHRRTLGFQLKGHETPLFAFAQFADRHASGQPLTTALALRWAGRRHVTAQYLSVLRNFARFCAAHDARTEIPAASLLGPQPRRRAAHIYSRADVRLMMQRAERLPRQPSPLAPFTYQAFIGLLYCTGLRGNEALRLRRIDFDPRAGTLLVPASKFSPARLLPLHPSAVRALHRYDGIRQRLSPLGDFFFPGEGGRPLRPKRLRTAFRVLTEGIVGNGARPRPRLHDFRHSFVTRIVAACSYSARPTPHHLVLLSRYLGHRHFSGTWWYVAGDPGALRSAAERFDRFRQGRHQREK
jgi:integrase